MIPKQGETLLGKFESVAVNSYKVVQFNSYRDRHDICQKFYTTRLFGVKILHKKCVNCDNGNFTTNQRKCFKMPNLLQ